MTKRKLAAAPTSAEPDVKEAATAALTPTPPSILKPEDFVSMGGALPNLAVSGRIDGGLAKGQIILWAGESNSFKTYGSMVLFAEAARNGHFNDYRFIYDGPEAGAKMNRVKHFGQAAAARIESPGEDRDKPRPSYFVEEFFDNVDDAFRSGEPFIYVLDSIDALTTEADWKKAETNKKARRKERKTKDGEEGEEEQVKGTMGMDKAKALSRGISLMLQKVQQTGSMVVFINQIRDNANPLTSRRMPKIASGGHARQFYSDVYLWSTLRHPLLRTVKGHTVKIGNMVRLEVRRTRVTGWEVAVDLPIYPSHGLDDVGACIQYLIEWKHWVGVLPNRQKPQGYVEAPEMKFKGTPEKLAQLISHGGHRPKLHALVQRVWVAVWEAARLDRKPEYV